MILILYVGTRRISGLLAEAEGDPPRVLRVGEIQNPEGFQKGSVSSLDKALHSLEELLKSLELGEEASEIPTFVLVSGSSLKMTRFSSSVYFTGYPRVVTSQEVHRVIEQTRSVAPLSLEEWVLQVVPESFWVNDLTGIEDPIGLEGERLAVTLQIFTMNFTLFRNLSRAFETLELHVDGYFPKTSFLAEGVLNANEREGEALVIDFSDEATHLVLTREGKMVQARSLDLGSRFLTTRIAETWQLGARDAERLKERFGSLEENLQFGEELVPLVERNGQPAHPIKRAEFHQAFARFGEELFQRVEKEIKDFLDKEKAARPTLVLTGGGVKLEGLLEFLSRRFPFPLRVGTPRPLEGSSEILLDPAWAGAVGFIRGLSRPKNEKGLFPAKVKPLERALLHAKEWLTAYF